MQDQRYNGWTNYETWNVALWLSNDEGTYNLTREMADTARVDAAEEDRDVRGTLADSLKDMIEEDSPDLGASMYSDLLNAALSEVDWYEIAENLLSES